jgi:hypothetical protein
MMNPAIERIKIKLARWAIALQICRPPSVISLIADYDDMACLSIGVER